MSKSKSRTKSRKSSSAQRGGTRSNPGAQSKNGSGTVAMESLEELFAAEVGTLLLEQKALLRKLPELADEAATSIVRQALRLATAGALLQAERLECLCEEYESEESLATHGVEGLLTELAEHATDEDETAPFKVIAGMRRMLRVQVAACGSAAAHAKLIGDRDAARLLREMSEGAECADRNLLRLCETGLQENLEELSCDFDLELSRLFQRRTDMANYGRYRDDDYDGGRAVGGRRSAQMQERDEYGQFAGYDGGGRYSGRYDDQDRGSRGYGDGRGFSRQYEEDEGRFGGQGGRSYGGRRSSQMQERDEYGQFAGYGGGRSGGRYDDDYNERGFRSEGRGGTSSYDDDDRGYPRRSRGSSSRYDYDDVDSSYGYGYAGGGRGEYTDSAGRQHSRDSWERAEEGRAHGGQYSQGGGRYRYDDDDRGYGSRSRGSARYDYDDRGYDGGGRGGYTDSAGRHYSRESWERAQEGRSRGGQHSHGGSRARY